MSFLSEGRPYLVNTFHHREGSRIEEFWTTDVGGASYGARKPLFVLTSKGTFSGGEEFAYDVKAFERGLVVGETTGGGATRRASQTLTTAPARSTRSPKQIGKVEESVRITPFQQSKRWPPPAALR